MKNADPPHQKDILEKLIPLLGFQNSQMYYEFFVITLWIIWPLFWPNLSFDFNFNIVESLSSFNSICNTYLPPTHAAQDFFHILVRNIFQYTCMLITLYTHVEIEIHVGFKVTNLSSSEVIPSLVD